VMGWWWDEEGVEVAEEAVDSHGFEVWGWFKISDGPPSIRNQIYQCLNSLNVPTSSPSHLPCLLGRLNPLYCSSEIRHKDEGWPRPPSIPTNLDKWKIAPEALKLKQTVSAIVSYRKHKLRAISNKPK
jgi:hypothetical protein